MRRDLPRRVRIRTVKLQIRCAEIIMTHFNVAPQTFAKARTQGFVKASLAA